MIRVPGKRVLHVPVRRLQVPSSQAVPGARLSSSAGPKALGLVCPHLRGTLPDLQRHRSAVMHCEVQSIQSSPDALGFGHPRKMCFQIYCRPRLMQLLGEAGDRQKGPSLGGEHSLCHSQKSPSLSPRMSRW